MQKENPNTDGEIIGEDIQRATAENQTEISGGSDGTTEILQSEQDKPEATKQSDDNFGQFEELIKGPYKDAFAKKVQGIINKRFKEQKIAEQKQKNAEGDTADKKVHQERTVKTDEVLTEQTHNITRYESNGDSTYEALIEAGVDAQTAYRLLHLDELLEASARHGAELAAKNLAESIRHKSARPTESGLKSTGGFAAKSGACGLTPEKRRELAKKALMGDKIGFN